MLLDPRSTIQEFRDIRFGKHTNALRRHENVLAFFQREFGVAARADVDIDLGIAARDRLLQGGLGQFLAKDLMPLALAHANRLQKFGA